MEMIELPRETVECLAWALLQLRSEWAWRLDYRTKYPDSSFAREYVQVVSLQEQLQACLANECGPREEENDRWCKQSTARS